MGMGTENYTTGPCGSVYAVFNSLGEIVFSGGRLEAETLAGRYRASGRLIRGRKPLPQPSDDFLGFVLDAAAESIGGRPVELPRPSDDGPGTRQLMSGWCTECSEYLERKSQDDAVMDASGQTHRHSNPWKLGPPPASRSDEIVTAFAEALFEQQR